MDVLNNLLNIQIDQTKKLAKQNPRLKIFVYAYMALNVGDDLFLQILFNRYPNVTFFIPAYSEYLQMFQKLPNVIGEVDRLQNPIQSMFFDNAPYDALIMISGSMFMGHFMEHQFNQYAQMIRQFVEANKKVFIIGANFDRMYTGYRVTEKNFFDLFKYGGQNLSVSLRDTHSQKFFKDLANVTYAPDIVFGLNHNFSPPAENRQRLGISVIPVNAPVLQPFSDKYIKDMVNLIKSSLAKNIDVVIFSFCVVEGDANVAQAIIEKLDAEEVRHVEHKIYNGDLENFLTAFAAMKYIVACRFHSVVLALKNRQALFPIVYNDKTLNLLEDLKIFSRNDFYDLRDKETLHIKKVWKLLERPKNLETKLAEFENTAVNHFKKLDEYIFGSSK